MPGELIFENPPCKVHLMSLHAERRETGVGLHRATLKKANTSIASFLDSQLIFQWVFGAAYRVTVLQRQKPGQQSNTAGLLIKWIWGYFWEDRPLWCYHIPVFVGFYCLIRINLTGEVCCPVYWGLWLWFEPCSPQSRNSLTAITAYLHLQHIGLPREWCSQCYESMASQKRQSHPAKR